MKRSLLSALLLAFLAFSSCAATLNHIIYRSIVAVTMQHTGGQWRICAGTVIDTARGWILTARHCVNPDVQMFVDGEPSELIKVGETLAILSMEKMTRPPLNLRKEDVQLGEQVTTLGFANGRLTLLVRYIAQKAGTDFALDNPLIPGMSGGPIIDQNGQMVGINQAADDALGYACGAKEIREFLGMK